MKVFRLSDVALCSLYVASKIEECPRKIRHIFSCFDRAVKRRARQSFYRQWHNASKAAGISASLPPVDPIDPIKYEKWMQRLPQLELLMLRELGFMLYVHHPFRYIAPFVQTFYPVSPTISIDQQNQLMCRAWSLVNDSFRCDLCVRQPPHVVAAAAIYLASRLSSSPDDIQPVVDPKFFVVLEVDESSLEDAMLSILSVYKHKSPPQYLPVCSNDDDALYFTGWSHVRDIFSAHHLIRFENSNTSSSGKHK